MTDYVALSGGIDSTALALLLPNATPVFTDTGWEFDELYTHLDNFEIITERHIERLQADTSLPTYIARQKFMPNHGARFCTRLFKIDVFNRWLADKLPATMCIGLHADEDARVGNLSLIDGLTLRYPLAEAGYTRMDCIRICLEHDLLPRYPAYMMRGGCKGCFYKRKSEVLAMAQLVPQVLDELQALEESIQDERGNYFHMFPNVGASIREIRAQQPLFDMKELYRDALDKSDMGAACGLFCNR